VEQAPAATPEPTNPPTSLADQYILPGIGGIIAAIAIVGVVLALLLRNIENLEAQAFNIPFF